MAIYEGVLSSLILCRGFMAMLRAVLLVFGLVILVSGSKLEETAETLLPEVEIERDTRAITPGYYSQECNAHKECKDGTKYCHMFLCVDCLKENVACTQNGQCCPGSECVYGRCRAGSKLGQAGTFCDRQSDCKDQDLCCVREPAINPAISICKTALDEHQTCGPYNQYRTVYSGGTVQPACGPCKQGLTCKQVGIFGVHQVCLPQAAAVIAAPKTKRTESTKPGDDN